MFVHRMRDFIRDLLGRFLEFLDTGAEALGQFRQTLRIRSQHEGDVSGPQPLDRFGPRNPERLLALARNEADEGKKEAEERRAEATSSEESGYTNRRR